MCDRLSFYTPTITVFLYFQIFHMPCFLDAGNILPLSTCINSCLSLRIAQVSPPLERPQVTGPSRVAKSSPACTETSAFEYCPLTESLSFSPTALYVPSQTYPIMLLSRAYKNTRCRVKIMWFWVGGRLSDL